MAPKRTIPAVILLITCSLICTKAIANVCVDPSSDADGDGWGFENGVSCTVDTTAQVTTGSCIDLDGDGWGWNGTSSCQTNINTSTNSSTSAQQGECIDDDGDGWGWNGTASCQTSTSIDSSVDTLTDTSTSTATDSSTDTAADPITSTDSVEMQPIVTNQAVEQPVGNNTVSNITTPANACVVTDLATLSQCIQQAHNYNHISITDNLSCSGEQCCPRGNPLIDLNGAMAPHFYAGLVTAIADLLMLVIVRVLP